MLKLEDKVNSQNQRPYRPLVNWFLLKKIENKNNMKKIITLCFVMFSLLMLKDSYAQQDAMYTQYMFQPMVYNPAYAGSRGAFSGTAIYRNQWTGIDGAPKTFSIAGHSPMGQSNSAVGIMIENDAIGVQKKLKAFVSYAYHIPFNRGKLSLGIQGGILNLNDNLGSLSATPGDLIDPTDPVYANSVSGTAPNFGAGVYYYSDHFFLGVGVPHILNTTIDGNGSELNLYTEARHYYATAGLILPLGNSLKFRPTALVKYVEASEVQAPIQVDLTAHFLINDALWLGAAARTGSGGDLLETIDFLLEYQFNQRLRVGYSYDLPMNHLTKQSGGSHEMMLGYDVFKEKSRVLTPRYF